MLEADGRFWHDGEPVQHPGLQRAFARWLRRHPDDGRYVLCNGYDWTYVAVRDAPHFVERVWERSGELWAELSDGSSEALDAASLRVGAGGALYVAVKGGGERARFRREAQLGLSPFLVEMPGGGIGVSVGGRTTPVELTESP